MKHKAFNLHKLHFNFDLGHKMAINVSNIYI